MLLSSGPGCQTHLCPLSQLQLLSKSDGNTAAQVSAGGWLVRGKQSKVRPAIRMPTGTWTPRAVDTKGGCHMGHPEASLQHVMLSFPLWF